MTDPDPAHESKVNYSRTAAEVMTGISAQSTQYNKSRNITVTKAEMKKYRKKNIPWD